MTQLIKRYNYKVIKNDRSMNDLSPTSCNCRCKYECPVDGKYLTRNVVYKATVKIESVPNMVDIGATEGPWK